MYTYAHMYIYIYMYMYMYIYIYKPVCLFTYLFICDRVTVENLFSSSNKLDALMVYRAYGMYEACGLLFAENWEKVPRFNLGRSFAAVAAAPPGKT